MVFGTNQWYWGMFAQSPKNDSHNDNINWLSLWITAIKGKDSFDWNYLNSYY